MSNAGDTDASVRLTASVDIRGYARGFRDAYDVLLAELMAVQAESERWAALATAKAASDCLMTGRIVSASYEVSDPGRVTLVIDDMRMSETFLRRFSGGPVRCRMILDEAQP